MNRASSNVPRLSALVLCIASACLLPACSSGGGARDNPSPATEPPPPPPPPPSPPPPPPPPPPPAGTRSLELPAAPAIKVPPTAPAYNTASGDLVKLVVAEAREILDSTSSAGGLTKQGDGTLVLFGNVRFERGTLLQSGTLVLDFGNLFSDVTIAPGATFEMTGDVIGDVVNNGFLDPTEPVGWYDSYYDGDIFGDYTQGSTGVLRLWFGLQGTQPATPLLTVSGTATLDGMVQFRSSGFVTAGGYLEWILHARGGVAGQFDGWTTVGSPLFLTGDLRYGPNDVFFQATRVSLQATMAAAHVGDALTQASARRVDAAFQVGDSLAALPVAEQALTQRQFLQSAAAIQRLQNYDQAVLTFDSLSGHGHVAATDALLDHALNAGQLVAAHAASWRTGSAEGQWTAQDNLYPVAATGFASKTSGHDWSLTDSLILGTRFGWSRDELQFDRYGGRAARQSPSWSFYLGHVSQNGWYVVGDVGYGLHKLGLDRSIDLGGRLSRASSDRRLEATHAYFEAGGALPLGGGSLAPFAAIGYAELRSPGFVEWGGTGFELQAQPSFHQRLSSEIGLRYSTVWRLGGGRWLRVGLDGRHRHLLSSQDWSRAAFTGTPLAEFELVGLSAARNEVQLGANLMGGGDSWSWQFRYQRLTEAHALSLGAERAFR